MTEPFTYPQPPLLAPYEEPQDDSMWPRGRVAYEELPPRLFDHLVARILELSPGSASTLLVVSRQFFAATARALYEEVELADDEAQLSRPPRHTQSGALLRHPENYARYVRKLVVGPRAEQMVSQDDSDQQHSSYFSFSPFCSSRPLSGDALLRVLELVPRLETFVWASDRVPPGQLCQLLARAVPELPFLAIRPEPRHDTGLELRPSGSQEGLSGLALSPGSDESAAQVVTSLGPPRWDAQNLHLLPRLSELNLAHISLDGSRYLASALTSLSNLRLLKLDFAFVDDLLLEAVGSACKQLEDLTLRTSGTKLTGQGLTTVMTGCRRLQALTLTEVEGRLAKTTWSKLKKLPPQLRSLRVAFNEVGQRHSWTCDHLQSVFELLKLRADESGETSLTTFAVSRIVPTTAAVRDLEEGFSALGLAYAGPGAPERSEACNTLVAPRPLAPGALELLARHGGSLRQLDLTFFALQAAEVRALIIACPKLEEVTLLVDATFLDLLGMHATFVGLQHLIELNISLLEAYSAAPHLTTRLGEVTTASAGRRRRSSAALPDASPTSSTLSTLSGSEPKTPDSPTVSPGRWVSKSQSAAAINQPLTSKDVHVPSTRDVRKFARGLSSLRVVRWTGRGAKGEWHLGPEGHGPRAVEFRSASEAAEGLARAMWTSDALGVNDWQRRAGGYEGLGAPRDEFDSDEDDTSVTSSDQSGDEEIQSGRSPARPTAGSGRRGPKSGERQASVSHSHSTASTSPKMSHSKAPSVASSRRSIGERTVPVQQASGIVGASTGGARQSTRSAPIPSVKTPSKASSSRAKTTPSSPGNERQGVVRRVNDEAGTIIIGHGRAARDSATDEGGPKGKAKGNRIRGKRTGQKKGGGNDEQQEKGREPGAKNGGASAAAGSSSPVLAVRRGGRGPSEEKGKHSQQQSSGGTGTSKAAASQAGRNGTGSGAVDRNAAPGTSAWSERRREEFKRSAAAAASPSVGATPSSPPGLTQEPGIWSRTMPPPGLPRRSGM